jgi:hypothetical protein
LAREAPKRHLGATTRKDDPMTDELLMRRWAAAHGDFSVSLDRGLLRLGHFLFGKFRRRQAIEKPYARAPHDDAQSEMSSTARAALAGVLACVATTALLVSLAALFSGGAVDQVAAQAADPASAPIIAHAILA